MNKVEKVSIGGYAFTLDGAAFAKVRSYIDALEARYSSVAGGNEIVEGIEERLAELLQERLVGKEIVEAADVEATVAILGVPEAIDDDGQESRAPEAEPRKRLYRDMEGKRVGGVCGGLGAYFNIDPVIFRIFFVALTLVMLLTDADSWFWAAPFAYFVLWLCIPQAKTVSQRCAMRGESGTAEEIGRNISAGMGEAGDMAHRVGNSDAWPALWRALGVCTGLLLLLIGICGLFTGLGLAAAGSLFNTGDLFMEIKDYVGDTRWLNSILADKWLVAMFAGIYFIPFIGTCYLGLKLVFGFKSPVWKPGITLFILWLILIVAAGVLFALRMDMPSMIPDGLLTF